MTGDYIGHTVYQTADGRRIPIDASACKNAPVTTFQEKGGLVVFVVRVDVAERLQTPERPDCCTEADADGSCQEHRTPVRLCPLCDC